MAHHKSAEKRMRQNRVLRQQNMHVDSTMRTLTKKVENAIQSKNIDEATDLLKMAIPIIDKAASKRVIHKNKASRKISKLTKRVNALQVV